jgi:uncharacterized membrane protein
MTNTEEAARIKPKLAIDEQVAVIVFAIGMIAMGAMCVVYRDFAYGWQPVPEFRPGRDVLAVFCGVLMIAFSLGLLFRKTAPTAARVMLAFLSLWIALKVPALFVAPQREGVWLGIGEIGMLLAGGLVLFAHLSNLGASRMSRSLTGHQGIRVAQIVFGLSVIPVGLSHLVYGHITASLVPSWLPFRLYVAYITGMAQMACGVALLFSLLPSMAAFIEAGLLALFAFLVWGPDTWFATTPKMPGAPAGFRFPFTAFLITWVIAASALLLAVHSARGKARQTDQVLDSVRPVVKGETV